MKIKIYSAFIIVVLFCSCSGNTKAKGYSNETYNDTVISPEESEEFENQPLLSLIKLDENTYVSSNGDTILIEKPFFRVYEGIVEGRKLQVNLAYKMAMEGVGYIMSLQLYKEGDEEYEFCWLEKITDDKWTNYNYESESVKPDLVFEYMFQSDKLFLRYKDQEISLMPGSVSYKAYNDFDYLLKYYNNAEDDIYYTEHWEYYYAAVPDQYTSEYTSFFSTDPFSKIDSLFYFKVYKNWKPTVHLAIEEAEEYEGFGMFFQDYYTPCYLDSMIYIVSNLSHNYMGGAHGMYGTKYYNFDVKSGKLLSLDDILIINEEFEQLYYRCLSEKFESIDFLATPSIPENFYLLPTGIVFCYYPYELLAFAYGEPVLFLSYDDLKPFLKF